MATDSDIIYTKDDLGNNLYRKKTYYTLVIEQDVLADSKDEADDKFMECGIDHSAITSSLTEEKDGVVTYYTEADYHDSEETKYMGKVVYDLSDPYAKEEGYVELDSSAEEIVKTPYTAGEGI